MNPRSSSIRTALARGLAIMLLVILATSALSSIASASGASSSANLGSGPAPIARAGYGFGGYTSTVLTPTGLPKSTHPTTLGNLYSLAARHQVIAATLDPNQDIVSFQVKGQKHTETAYFIDATSLSTYLLAKGVNVEVGIVSIPTSSSPIAWLPVVVFAMGFLALALYALFRHRNKKEAKKTEQVTSGVGGTHAGLIRAEVPTTTFADVAGCEEAVTDLAEFVEFLMKPERFAAVGATMPKGALLCGPPGTGKTLLARAVAGEAGVPFYAVSGADFTEIYVGVGPKRVRDLFARARKAGKAIIFIDEIDAIAKRRSDNAHTGGDSERDSTLIALLNEMDGFRDSEVIVIAATNRPDILDPAITRPGRLDRRIEVPLPDRRGREKILAVHAHARPLASNVNLEHVARRTSGMSGAELAQIVNEACIEAARAELTTVNAAHFDQAVATVAMGRARTSAVVTDADRLVTAWHEAGHTACAYLQDAADKPVSVSIIPRGPAGGVTWMSEGDDIFLQRSKASARLVTALGGRAAEELLLGDDYTQGAYGDLTSATNLAFSMATRYGMTNLGLMVRDPNILGPSANEGVNEVVEALLTGALEEARRILTTHYAFTNALVEALLDNDTLSKEEIDAVYNAVYRTATHPEVSVPKALLGSLTSTSPSTKPQEAVVVRPTPVVEEPGVLVHVAHAFAALAQRSKRRKKQPPQPSF